MSKWIDDSWNTLIGIIVGCGIGSIFKYSINGFIFYCIGTVLSWLIFISIYKYLKQKTNNGRKWKN